ncbi:hypothetical protein GHT09_011495 [Marmota monax]|uniref:Uncharacterized protein n=1 Tax=Marmota monax TaxID=9995 RepID=A0A834PNJ4_MARMO|nr:hypothetical protein GHT09_011495 [Marmota monax]
MLGAGPRRRGRGCAWGGFASRAAAAAEAGEARKGAPGRGSSISAMPHVSMKLK